MFQSRSFSYCERHHMRIQRQSYVRSIKQLVKTLVHILLAIWQVTLFCNVNAGKPYPIFKDYIPNCWMFSFSYIDVLGAKWESVQFRNCPAQNGNSHFIGLSRNSSLRSAIPELLVRTVESGQSENMCGRISLLMRISLLIILNRG